METKSKLAEPRSVHPGLPQISHCKYKIIFCLISLAALCLCAAAQENTSDYWYKNAGELLANGSTEDALRAYDKAIEIDQNNATIWSAKGYALSSAALFTNNQSRYNESLEALDKALQIEPNNPRAWEFKGLTFTLMKRYSESLDAYDKAIENIGSYRGRVDLPPNRTEYLSYLWQSKAVSILQMGRTEESLDALDNATKIDAANFGAWATKGEVLTYLGRYNESIQAYNDALDVAPSELQEIRASPLMSKGYALMATGRYERALEVYENISALNLTEESAGFYLPDAWRGRGNALSSLGKYNESIQAFDRAIELNSEKAPYAWTGKGDALLASGRHDEAVEAYDNALNLYPEYADAGIARAQKGRGDSLARLGKQDDALAAYSASVEATDEAISAFNNATPLDKAVSFTFDPYPLDQKFWTDRGNALNGLGREQEARQAYEKALEWAERSIQQSPQDFNAYDNKAKILFELSRCNESIQVYDQFIETNPGPKASATALVWKGLLLFEMGRANESRENLSRAIEVDPQSDKAWRWKAGISAELGRYEEALAAYDEALRLGGLEGDAGVWQEKGGVLKALGRQSEADAIFAKARELGY